MGSIFSGFGGSNDDMLIILAIILLLFVLSDSSLSCFGSEGIEIFVLIIVFFFLFNNKETSRC